MKYKGVLRTFGRFLPDQQFIGDGLETAHQVLLLDGSLQRVQNLSRVSGAFGVASQELMNALWAHDDSGTRLYAATRSHLWEVNSSTGATTDRCKGGHYTGGEWTFVKFGNNVIAANPSNPLQTIAPGVAAADLCTSTTKPQGKYLCACRGHVILANISAPAAKPREFRWSGRFAPADWEPGSNRAGFGELFTDAGIITGCAGFEDFWLLFTSAGVFRASYIGGDAVWSLQQVGYLHDSLPRGLYRSIVLVGRDAFYLSRSGPKVVINGETIRDLGAGSVRRAMLDYQRSTVFPGTTNGSIPFGTQSHIYGCADSLRRVIYWGWEAVGDSSYDLVVWAYSIEDDAWTTLIPTSEALGVGFGAALVSREYGASLAPQLSGPAKGLSILTVNSAGDTIRLDQFDGTGFFKMTLAPKLEDYGPGQTGLHAVRPRIRYSDGASNIAKVKVKVDGWEEIPTNQFATPDVTQTLDFTSTSVDERGFAFFTGGPLRAAFYSFTVTVEDNGNPQLQIRDFIGLDLLLDPEKSDR